MHLVTDMKEAEGLYRKFNPQPSCWWQQWHVRRRLFDDVSDTLFFLTDGKALLPLQIGEVGVVEWFGGWLIEGNSWLGDLDSCCKLVSIVRPLHNELDWVDAPLLNPYLTIKTKLPSHHMDLPTSYETWHAALKKKRRYDLRKADKYMELQTFHVNSGVDVLQWCEICIDLSVQSFAWRGNPKGSYFAESDYFKRYLRRLLVWTSDKYGVDVVLHRHWGKVVGVAFGLDPQDQGQYYWLFAASNPTIGPDTGKRLLADMVRCAIDAECTRLCAGADDLTPNFKTMMGCQQQEGWSVAPRVEPESANEEADEEEE